MEWDAGAGPEIVLPARRLTAPAILDLARRAEASGWAGVWVSEVLSLDAAAVLGAIAVSTSRVRIGASILPVSTRSAALLAMTASTVAQLAPGRVAFGLGVSTPGIVADRHDRPVRRPVAETIGTLDVVRRALRGESVTRAAEPTVTDLRIDPLPAEPPPVLLGAFGPRLIQVAHAHADGLVLNTVTGAVAADLAAAGRAAAGPGYPTLLSQRMCVEPTPDDDAAARREIASYCRVPAYAESMTRQGWDLAALRAADPADAAAHLPDDLFAELCWLGSAADCRDRLDALAKTGVHPLCVPVGTGDATGRLLAALAGV
jgi:alkanesulfonate monooxygenase SsuD/methylene tetrahydromethanopterin reductase-like flavin-dependent oxidoreductase (luciferase family)